MKTFLTRALPLLLCIAVGAALSWSSVYAFWFAARTLHSVPALRACDAVGSILLLPAKYIFELLGGDQTTIFFVPTAYWGTNGLVLGILFYCVFRGVLRGREAKNLVVEVPAQSRRIEAKVA